MGTALGVAKDVMRRQGGVKMDGEPVDVVNTQGSGLGSVPSHSDEAAKAALGVEGPRCDDNVVYSNVDSEATAVFQATLARHYLIPTPEDLAQSETAILDFVTNPNVRVVIPMREMDKPKPGEEARVAGGLDYLLGWLDPNQILVVQDDSSAAALEAVRRRGVKVLDTREITKFVDWNKLFSVLGLKDHPRGKGTAMWAGYLYEFARARKFGSQPHWLLFHDAETRNSKDYRALETWVWGLLQFPQAHYGQIARGGRNNEVPMAARVMMDILGASWVGVDPAISQRASQLFEGLTPSKWMCTGEFGLRGDWAFNALFATGYLIETFLATQAFDQVAWLRDVHSFYAEAPATRLDGTNTWTKEGMMMQSIAKFILALALSAKSTIEWDLDFIRWFNTSSPFATPQLLALIPPPSGPVEAKAWNPEKVLPSPRMLVENEMLNVSGLMELVD